jgi:2-polyprenyl-3-methyl-5-hydroxy-6-metoxy-1,4-benzoquinol methylase
MIMLHRLLTPLLLCAALAVAQKPKANPAESWDRLYASRDAKVPVNPSAIVLESTANLQPGTALDIGMGNGRNAVYLARKGWKVTGIDASREAVKLATAEAQKLNTTVEGVVANFETYDPGRGKYDLILCTYAASLATAQARKIIDALKPGGLLIVEGSEFQPNQLLRTYGKLRVLRYEDRLDRGEWANGGDTRTAVYRLVARK